VLLLLPLLLLLLLLLKLHRQLFSATAGSQFQVCQSSTLDMADA
jgi:hypothetical protein